MLLATNAGVCPVRYCGRLVSAALPLYLRSSPSFDTGIFCSQHCATLHARDGYRKPSSPLVTCDICCETKALTDYIHNVKKNSIAPGNWNISVPQGCLPHLAPELLDMGGGTCTDCLRSHVRTQFETRGAINISCVQKHRTGLLQDWLPYASHFLSQEQHDSYQQQLFESYMNASATDIWVCPTDCGYNNGIIQPNDTPGYPHVECPGCHDRFCANCKVRWHTEQTCQQYRAQHPELHDEHEVQQLREMEQAGARRCPRCQFIIVKDGGCDHMFCEQCRFDFDWQQAELVVAPAADCVYPPVFSHASSAFRGWGQLRQAQEAYINRNNIDDTPFDVGTTDTAHDHDSMFYYDFDNGFWSPELCELDEIARRAAGNRMIRSPEHDRENQWAFREVEYDHEGGIGLQDALDGLVAASAADEAENRLVPEPIHIAWGGHVNIPIILFPTMQRFNALSGLQGEDHRLTQEISTQPSSPANADAAPPADDGPFVPPWGPLTDAMNALFDPFLFGGESFEG